MFENLGILNIGTYIIGVIFIILVPGPNSLYVLKSSATFGYKKGYQAALGVFTGDAVLIMLSFLGVASVIKASRHYLPPCVTSVPRIYCIWD